MASRTSWEGYLRLNLVSVPVKAYNAAVGGSSGAGFHLIHAKCENRIHYKKVCPVHGEVPNDEIVSAYEFAKGKYVAVDAEERAALLPEDEKTIAIDTFIKPGALDPIYYGDRSYYVVPDGKVAQKPYAVLQEVMAERGRYALAHIVMSGRGHIALLRPLDGLLVMTLLNYDDEVKKPSEFDDDRPDVAVNPKERELARDLVDASTATRFNFSGYKDEYAEKLAAMLETRSAKKDKKARAEEEPVVLNLMDALRASLAHTKGGSEKKSAAARHTVPKKSRPAHPARRGAPKKKTG